MAFELKKPCSNEERCSFIITHNHKNGLRIVDTPEYLYALEKNEILENNIPTIDPTYEERKKEERMGIFSKDFFLTSLGYIRRKVTMATDEIKDFLSDLLPTISMGLQSGEIIKIITYKEPDFSTDDIDWESLQEYKIVTQDFIKECYKQLSNDFKIIEDANTSTNEGE